jgi:hypothetical protein
VAILNKQARQDLARRIDMMRTVSRNSSKQMRRRRAAESPHLVWHYTGFKGLEGILAGTIWASSAAYLNDTQEFRYALNVAAEEFKALIDDYSVESFEDITNEHMKRYRSVHKLRTVVGRQFIGVQGADVLVTSFSTQPDHLSQWRAYGGAGPSFSVGFDAVFLRAKAAESGFSFDRVRYGREVRRDIRRLLAPRVRSIFDEKIPRPSPSDLQTTKIQLAEGLRKIAAFTKGEALADEGEWRLVRRMKPRTASDPVSQFRQSGSLVVPYIEIPLHESWPDGRMVLPEDEAVQSPVCAITVGPSPHPKELQHAVEEMTRARGFKNIEVTSSRVPFRNW